jgi:hypothetical protein
MAYWHIDCVCFDHRAFLDALTDEQLRRYEAYRRTAFPKMTMKRVRIPCTLTVTVHPIHRTRGE